MVDLGGGFIVDDVYKSTTHVISEVNTKELRDKCTKFRKVHMVTAQWIIDSYNFGRKPIEAHYLSVPESNQ